MKLHRIKITLLLISVLMPVFAQADQTGDADVYKITPKDAKDGPPYFATIENPSTDLLQLQIYSKPGSNPGEKATVAKSKVLIELLGQKLAEKEIEKQLNEVSQMVNGVRVFNEEIDRAKRAQTMADELEAHLAMPELTTVNPTETPPTPADPGPLAMRGPQIVLVLGAFIVIGIIVKLMILE